MLYKLDTFLLICLSELSTFSLSSLLNFLYFVQAMVYTEEAMELTVAMVGMVWV